MTWKELAKEIQSWPDEQQNDDISIYVQSIDEFAPGELQISDEENDIIGTNRFFIDAPI